MNFRAVTYILGWILIIEGALMLLPVIAALIYGEPQGVSFAVMAGVCVVTGMVMRLRRPSQMTFFTREGFAVTSLAWILLSIFGCLPFVMNGDIPSFTDALFETVSGFTTTGASILDDVEALSHTSLLWRSFTHWIGGMGVLVFLLALIPMTGGSTMNIMRAESPGPTVSKLLPKIRQTAFALYAIYFVLTAAEFVFLVAGRMPVFDAAITAFGTAGTGGFGIKADSMASYSPYLQWVITVFMAAFGVNFSMYFMLYTRRFKAAARHEETRIYLILIFAAAAVILISIFASGAMDGFTIAEKIRHTFFQVASIITTTGFSTIDYDTLWPQTATLVLVILMFIGASAGSTGGGIKISRILILARSVRRELQRFFHPQRVVPVKAEGKPVPEDTVRLVGVYMAAYILIFVISMFIVSFDGNDFTTNFTAIAATINNIGPGLSKAGPTESFSLFSGLSKYTMIFDMLAGRLELYPMLMLIAPEFWKSIVRR